MLPAVILVNYHCIQPVDEVSRLGVRVQELTLGNWKWD